ncbi:hypothetical protein, partial [Desertihabitans aurantiacus]|uniref:hypothetical protein n=1 Tax=Desertihabitans aurantiacus TaxID=2282477 RepID=UPI0018E51206
MRLRTPLTTLAALALVGGGLAAPAAAEPGPAPAADEEARCVDLAARTTGRMSLKHRIGQLVMSQPSADGLP